MTAPETWSPTLQEGVQKEELSVLPYELELGYDYWSYREFLTSRRVPENQLTRLRGYPRLRPPRGIPQ